MPLDAAELATLSRLLDEALDLAPDALAPWLDALPPAQQHLRPQLQEMLERQRATAHAGFLSDGPRLDAADPSAPRAGDRVGPYVLIRELGQGGMGTVWLGARADGALRRQVALKLPRLAWGAGLAKRMARERDILARLEHPTIARLYDAGVDEQGRPYLALEFIDGQPVDAWCEARALPLRERLALIAQVAHAVGVAHGSLVVHRDLKPSNILVTPDGQVHLLDFGIAKLLESTDGPDSDVTQTQARLLTPRYASPEQAEGRPVTVASDVYSLGVVLHQLLTGRLPALPSPNEDPAPASRCVTDRSVARTLRGDLDAIVGKALRHDPARRYETMQAFAGDLENHLAGRPVQARPDGALYIAGRFARRHWIGLSAVTAVCAAIVVGGTTAIVQARHAEREAERARAATEFVTELFRLNASGSDMPGTTAASTQFIDRGASLIQTRFAGRPDMQAELMGAVGQAYEDMGANALAVEYANQRLNLLRQLPDDTRTQQVGSLLLASDAYLHDDDAEAAETAARQALVAAGTQPELRLDAMASLARAQMDAGRLEAAGQTIKLGEDLLKLESRLDKGVGQARLLGARAMLLILDGHVDESKPMTAMAVEMSLKAEGAGSRTAEDLLYARACALLRFERLDEAREDFGQAMAIVRQHGGGFWRAREALSTVTFLATALGTNAMRFDEVIAQAQSSHDALQALGASVPAVVRATVDFQIGRLYLDWTNLHKAVEWLEPNIKLLQASKPSLRTRQMIATAQFRLAGYLGRDAEVLELVQRDLQLRKQLYGANSPAVIQGYGNFANVLISLGKLDLAAQVLDEAPTITYAARHKFAATYIAFDRVKLAMARGDTQRAYELLPSVEQLTPWGQLSLSPMYGWVLCSAGESSRGLTMIRDSIRGFLAMGGYVGDPDIVRTRGRAGLCALIAGRRPLAIQCALAARRSADAEPLIGPRYLEPLGRLETALGLAGKHISVRNPQTPQAADETNAC